MKQQITEVNTDKIPTLYSNVLCAEQKQDVTCKKLASKSHHSNKYFQHSSYFC